MEVQSLKSYILLVITTFFWGVSWPITKYLVSLAPSFTIGFFRFFIASLFFIPLLFLFYKPLKYKKEVYLDFFLTGLTGVFLYGILFLIAMNFTTAAQGSIIAGVNPAMISIWAHILHKERLDAKWKYSGFIISFIGVIFVVGIQALLDFQIEHLIGNLIIVVAMCCWGLYSNLGKKTMKEYSPFETTSGAVIFGMLMFSVGAFSEQAWKQPALQMVDFWSGVLYLGFFVTFLSFLFFFIAIKNIGTTQSGIFINLVPIFGTFFSWLLLKESIYWTFLIGLLLIIIGILVINYPIEDNTLTRERDVVTS
ncbi:MAG: DMT family transporter [Candidatus Hodarchaeales archaeon]|jgi:drug/metabolite transporter (DMT)-like permease